MLSRRDGVPIRRVHHQNAHFGGGFQVDVVDSDSGATHNLQFWCGFEQIERHFGLGANHQSVIVFDRFKKLRTRKFGRFNGFDAAAF